jgi:CBS domain-containing protein
MPMRASEVMTREVVTVAPDSPVREIASLLLQYRISAVPVTINRSVIGIVSEGDLMHRPENETERMRSWWLEAFTDSETLARDYVKTHGLRAIDVMTRHVISVGEEAEVGEIAQLLDSRRIKRVPVVREGRLVGIVSRADLLRALVAGWPPAGRGTAASDHALHEAIIAHARAQRWSDVPMLNVVVRGGDVELSGVVASEDHRRATRILVEGIPGVRSVRDNLAVVPHWAYAD